MTRPLTAVIALSLSLAPACKGQGSNAEPARSAAQASGPAAAPATPVKPAAAAAQAPAPASATIEAGFQTPETVLYDPAADDYLVSNINGSPTAKDGNGFISRVGPDLKVIALKWIAGGTGGATLNAPKGMALAGDTLYVADIDAVRMFDRKTGAPRGEIAIKGATFLNGADALGGVVYVSDTGTGKSAPGAVYAIKGKRVSTVARGAKLMGPNGVLAAKDGVWVVTFGDAALYRLTAAGEMKDVTKLPSGSLDGVVRLAGGDFLVSSWKAQAVFEGRPGGSFRVAVSGVTSPAGIGYDGKRNRLLIPLFEKNRIEVRTLAAAAH